LSLTRILDPGCAFPALVQRLAPCGWRVVDASGEPLLPGEPEQAVFERDGGDRLQYTFNPVCLLRVLEASRLPDPETLSQLPLASDESVGAWLASGDERTLLRGVLAARVLKQVQWLARLKALSSHPSGVVSKAAAAAAAELGQAAAPAAPALAAASIALLEQQVRPLLLALAQDPAGPALESVRPRDSDADRAFTASAAAAARQAYADVWRQPPRIQRASAQARLTSHFAPAGMLADDNALSRFFPGGYRAIAPLLDPHRVWVAWKMIEPGHDAGMTYDGLVWLDDHWAWFPKPYRVLASLVRP